jgi:hypothetical protein
MGGINSQWHRLVTPHVDRVAFASRNAKPHWKALDPSVGRLQYEGGVNYIIRRDFFGIELHVAQQVHESECTKSDATQMISCMEGLR